MIPGTSWKPYISNQDQFLQINLFKLHPIYGVITQGSGEDDDFVTSYQVLHSEDGNVFSYVMNVSKSPAVFRGPADSHAPMQVLFNTPIESKIIRIQPLTWHNAISMQVELLGCADFETTTSAPVTTVPPVCTDTMGVDSGLLPLSSITFSSDIDEIGDNRKVRLESLTEWQPRLKSKGEWVQVRTYQSSKALRSIFCGILMVTNE